MPATPFWTTGIPRTPAPKDRVIGDMLARMNGPQTTTIGSLTVTQILTIRNATPQLRFNEVDQSAPAAEWRWRVNGKSFDVDWAETAGFASIRNLLNLVRVSATVGRLAVGGGNTVTPRTDSVLALHGEAVTSLNILSSVGGSGGLAVGDSADNDAGLFEYEIDVAQWHLYTAGVKRFDFSANTFEFNEAMTFRTPAAANMNFIAQTTGVMDFTAGGSLRFRLSNVGMGFFGATPVAQPGAYTQTYSTADKTHATPTVGADIGVFTDPPTAAEMATLRTFVNALKADHVDLAQLVNAIIDDGQALGLLS